MVERRITTIRLFGVNITVEENDHHSTTQTHHQHMITIHETSRKRKISPDQEEEEDEQSDDSLDPKKPKILRLFGVDIPIDHLLTTSSQQDQPIPQNPNQEHEDEEEAPAAIPQFDHEQVEEEADAPIPQELHPVFLFEKELTYSDVTRSHNRLLITRSRRLMAALTEEERGRVESNRPEFLRVVTTYENGVEYTLRLKKWVASGAIVLKYKWGELVRENGLQIGDSVQGWGYRVDGEFRLLLHVIRSNQLN